MIKEITIYDYYNKLEYLPIIDVRSPREFEQGHIIGAVNIPLFSNEERAKVGTVYKRQSKEKAVELGYEFVTPKLQSFLDESKEVCSEKGIVVHCWRGGMRSHSFAQHLIDNGFKNVIVLTGGYKSYRNHVLDYFQQEFKLNVLGGYTGSGKTTILQELDKLGEQIIDLEGIAHHKGSAFGALGEERQPSSEHFENTLFEYFRKLDIRIPIWIEDESARIGCVHIPQGLYLQMRKQMLYFIAIPKEERAKYLVEEYACFDDDMLCEAVERIRKRLGGQHANAAKDALKNKEYYKVAMITLQYYDKAYWNGVEKRGDNVMSISLPKVDSKANAKKLIEIIK